jgi:hypothetical protein
MLTKFSKAQIQQICPSSSQEIRAGDQFENRKADRISDSAQCFSRADKVIK